MLSKPVEEFSRPFKDCTFQHFKLEVYWLLPFKQDGKDFFSPLEMEACMLAVIPRHLFVLVCGESLKRVPCPNWKCLPFRHLYESNDPRPQGRLFMDSLFFTIFSNLNCLPHKMAPIMFQEHYSSCIPKYEVTGGGKVLEQSIYHMCSSIGCPNEGQGNTKASWIPQLQDFHSFPVTH